MKRKLLVLLIIVLSVSMVSCSSRPEGEPEEIISEYYSLIDSSNYESAYDLLSERNKKNVDLEKFEKWNDLLKEIYIDDQYEYELIEEFENESLDGEEFENIVKFKINKKFLDIYSDKDESGYNEEYVISEDGEWKVYRLKEDFNIDQKIASIYNTLGHMYYDGEGKKLDINRSIEMHSKSLEYNDISSYNYSLATALVAANRYDEGMEAANKSLVQIEEDSDGEENKEILSDIYNLIGVIYLEQFENDLAIENFEKAIELDPNNQYAITNLNDLK